MRGPRYRRSYRGGQLPPAPANEADGYVYSLPPPIGGWNTARAPVMMPETDALVLDNIYPDINDIRLRGGISEWATGLSGGWVRSFLKYVGGASSKIFASTDTGIYNVTLTGAVGAAASSCTNGDWEYSNLANSGGNYLIAVNGTDAAKLYNGTTWSATTISGVTDSNLNHVVLFKRRLWFIEKNTMNAWYLAADAIGGAATVFRFGPVFPKGGYLVAQFVWSVDGGNGLDDYLITVSSEGEIAVYGGTDPASASTFALVGTYDVGVPLGKKCFVKYGGDVLYLSTRGIFPLSRMLISANRSDAISQKIDDAFKSSSTLYKANIGWHGVIYPEVNALVVNVPVIEETTYHQYVMNDVTKAWCRFTGWDLHSFTVFNDVLYAGGDGTVYLAWVGSTDDGEPITGISAQAYSNYARGLQKQPQLIRPVLSIQGTATVLARIDADFKNMIDNSVLALNFNGNTALWDEAVWDSSVWSGEDGDIESKWTAVPGEPGYLHSLRIQITTSSGELSWKGTNILSRMCGVL